jgi:hypothetical protein
MDNQTKIGIGATAGFALAGIAALVFNSWWVSGPTMVVCALVALWGLWPLVKGGGWSVGYIPLGQATARLYGQTRNSELASFAEVSGLGSPDDIRDCYGYWVANHGVRIFGRRNPSPNRELVPKGQIGKRLYFGKGATLLTEQYNESPVFVDLAVKWIDLVKNRKALLGKK